ncbi:DUF2059 domain-containing protein [Uliginosibacterium sp. 31-16]|uniref:DUF2059 domain-containing protein n=1 Tax=Uliginosibacterium sp. 31-16 TaxID=3068315 RepID=UPI00273F6EE9|nr:DUF2059 domain-containing protein [Uliginosibacterium sp. 31-16]MDP5240966.1 DUF2059 domain-containing protein [Uliginosibacterium sp. 31-16]
MKRLVATFLMGCSLAAWADEAAHRKLAEELMGLTQTETSVRNWRKRLEGQAQEVIDEAMQGRRPEQLSEAQRQAVRRFTERGGQALEGGLAWSKLKDPLARLYMETFTESETRELVAFYRTPTGQKMLSGLPALAEGVTRVVRGQVDGMRPQLQGISQDFHTEFARAVSEPATDKPFDKRPEKALAKLPSAAKPVCVNARTGRSC